MVGEGREPPERDFAAGDWVFRVRLYDHAAPRIFEQAQAWLARVVPFAAGFEHVGSTAVPGLGGRGSIDILVLVEPERVGETAEALRQAGLHRTLDAPPPDCRSMAGRFIRPSGEDYPVHVHVTWPDSVGHRALVGFRDYLRAHPAAAAEYGRLKYEWSRVAGPDDAAYHSSKTSHIRRDGSAG